MIIEPYIKYFKPIDRQRLKSNRSEIATIDNRGLQNTSFDTRVRSGVFYQKGKFEKYRLAENYFSKFWRLSCEIIDQLYIGSPFLRYFGLAKQSCFFPAPAEFGIASRLNAPATSRERWIAIATIDARGLQNAMRSGVQRILP